MKITFDLYRCHASEWGNMIYTDALLFRIEKATEAMAYYKEKAGEIDSKIHSKEYKYYAKKFEESEDAVEWNRQFCDETKVSGS